MQITLSEEPFKKESAPAFQLLPFGAGLINDSFKRSCLWLSETTGNNLRMMSRIGLPLPGLDNLIHAKQGAMGKAMGMGLSSYKVLNNNYPWAPLKFLSLSLCISFQLTLSNFNFFPFSPYCFLAFESVPSSNPIILFDLSRLKETCSLLDIEWQSYCFIYRQT